MGVLSLSAVGLVVLVNGSNAVKLAPKASSDCLSFSDGSITKSSLNDSGGIRDGCTVVLKNVVVSLDSFLDDTLDAAGQLVVGEPGVGSVGTLSAEFVGKRAASSLHVAEDSSEELSGFVGTFTGAPLSGNSKGLLGGSGSIRRDSLSNVHVKEVLDVLSTRELVQGHAKEISNEASGVLGSKIVDGGSEILVVEELSPGNSILDKVGIASNTTIEGSSELIKASSSFFAGKVSESSEVGYIGGQLSVGGNSTIVS